MVIKYLLHTTETVKFIKAVSDTVTDTVFDMIYAVYHDKPLVFTRATFRKKLVSHHRAMSEADSCPLMRCINNH